MAKRREPDETIADTVADEPVAEVAPAVQQHVRIVNLGKYPRDIHLTSGRVLNLGGKLPGCSHHISGPVLRKLIGPALRALEVCGAIRIETVEEVTNVAG